MTNFKKFINTDIDDFRKEFNSRTKEIRYEIGLDSEFEPKPNKPTQFISTQIDDTFYEHPTCGLAISPTWKDETTVFVDHFGLDRCYRNPNFVNGKRFLLKCYVYFTFADIVACFNERDIPFYIALQCIQDRVIRPRKQNQKYINTGLAMVSSEGFCRQLFIYIYDTSAFFGKTSLEEQLEILNINLENKQIIPREAKSNMKAFYCNSPEQFKRYAVFDSLVLHKTTEEHNRFWTEVCTELGIPWFAPSQSIGSNTAKVITRLIEKILFKHCTQADKELFKKILAVKTVWQGISKLNEEATISILNQNTRKTSVVVSLIDGGRCKNERPTDTVVKGVLADIDIQGCYGNGLLNQKYPIGRPCIIDYYIKEITEDSDPRPTLGEFLNSKIGKDLSPGLWYARVSTTEELSFQQDLILSKIPYPSDSEFVLQTNEITFGTLTADILEVLRSVCSDREFGELKRKLRIETLVFYPKSMEVPTVKDLMDNETSPPRTIQFDDNYHSDTIDRRSKYWTSIDFGDGWIDALIEKRRVYPKGTPLNTLYKLIINSTYGVLTSEHFDSGNVVVTSNITARARVLAWLMAKALGCYQTITDGGLFDLNSVNYYDKDYTPSMNTLCNINRPELLNRTTRHRIRQAPLNNEEWSYDAGDGLLHGGTQVEKTLIDKVVWQHLKDFFNSDEITILRDDQFNFETKDVYKEASFQAQANYRFVKFDGEEIFKARGYETKKELYADKDCTISYHETYPDREGFPIEQCLRRIADGKPIPPYPPAYTQNVLKVSAFHKMNQSDRNPSEVLLPGDSVSKKTHLRPLSLSAFRFQTHDQYKTWLNLSERTKQYCDFGLEAYFVDENGYFDYQEAVETIQQMIDRGSKCPYKLSDAKLSQDDLFGNIDNDTDDISSFYSE